MYSACQALLPAAMMKSALPVLIMETAFYALARYRVSGSRVRPFAHQALLFVRQEKIYPLKSLADSTSAAKSMRLRKGRLIRLAAAQKRKDDTRRLVGKRNRSDVLVSASANSSYPLESAR